MLSTNNAQHDCRTPIPEIPLFCIMSDFGAFHANFIFPFLSGYIIINMHAKLGLLSEMTFFVGYLCVFLGVKKVCDLLV